MTSPPPSGRRGSTPPGQPRNTYQMMQAMLQSQQAANQATTQTMQQLQLVAGLISQTMVLVQTGGLGPVVGPGGSVSGSPGVPGAGGGVSNRPVMNQHQGAHRRGLAGVRASVAQQIHRSAGLGGGSRYVHQYDDQGNHTGTNEYRPDGSVTTHAPGVIDEQTVAQGERRAMVSRVAGGLGAGGAMGAARAIPYVGAAIMGAEAIHEGVTFVSNQRAANAQYQSIYGGSNLGGLGQRFDQAGFQLGQLFGGGLSWGQSREAFQGVSALGLQGNARSNDLNFITQNYMRMGMSVKDSLQLVQTATENLNKSLSGLQDGLRETTKAAQETGQNAAVARQNYTRSYQQLGSVYSDVTGGTTQITNAIAPLQTRLGRGMEHVNLAGMLTDPGQIAVMANRLGVSPTQFMGMVQANDPRVTKALDYNLSRAEAPALGNRNVQNYLSQQVKSIGGQKALNSDSVSIIAQNMLQNADSIGFNVQQLQAQYAASGLPGLTPEEATRLMISGGENLRTPRNAGLVKAHPPVIQNYGTRPTPGHGPQYVPQDLGNMKGVNPVIDAAKSKLKGKMVQVNVNGQHRVMPLETAAHFYPDQIGKGTAIVEGTGGRTVSDMLGGQHQDKVYVGAGVSHYANEKNPGSPGYDKAHDLGGYSVAVDTTKHKISETRFEKDAGLDPKGMSVEAYNKMIASKEGGSKGSKTKTTGVVTISPSPELARLLNITASGNAQVATTGAAYGLPVQPGS